MMIDDRLIQRVCVGTIVAPLLFAALVRVVEPEPLPGPSEASAQTDEEAGAQQPARRLKPTETQRSALASIASRPADSPVRNVFLYPRAQVQRIDITPTQAPAQVEKDPTFELSSIMTTRRGDVALINGRLRHIGDEVVPEWFVVAIDPVARTVTIENTDGRTNTVRMPTGLGR